MKIYSDKNKQTSIENYVLDEWMEEMENNIKGSFCVYLQLIHYESLGKPAIKEIFKKSGVTTDEGKQIIKYLEEIRFIEKNTEGIKINKIPRRIPVMQVNIDRVENKPLAENKTEYVKKHAIDSLTRLVAKEVDKWNPSDFIRYFKGRYIEKFNSPYSVTQGKDGKLFSKLMEDYSKQDIINLIDFAIENWVGLLKKTGNPTIGSVFYFRNELYTQVSANNIGMVKRLGEF